MAVVVKPHQCDTVSDICATSLLVFSLTGLASGGAGRCIDRQMVDCVKLCENEALARASTSTIIDIYKHHAYIAL